MRSLREQRHPSPAREFLVGVLLLLAYMLLIGFLGWLFSRPYPPEPIKPSAEPTSNLAA